MPMHDWSRVEPNDYRHFHGRWIYAISDRLNKGLLPPDYYATAEQVIVPYGADVLTLEAPRPRRSRGGKAGGTATATATKTVIKPEARAWERSPADERIRPRRRIEIRHNSGQAVVAVIELVSPANKRSRDGFRQFVNKSVNYICSGIHLMVIDPFAPGRRDPDGMHAVIWRRLGYTPRELPDERRRLVVSYAVGKRVSVYLEPFDLDQPVPDMMLFLTPTRGVTVPLESTYLEAWDNVPGPIRDRLLI